MGLVKSDTNENLSESFKLMALEAEAILRRFGCKTKAFHDASLPDFSNLETSRQKQATQDLKKYLESLKAALESETDMRNDKQALWSALRYYGLTPRSDIFEAIKKGDAVEIYDLDKIQIWRNLSFMDICSYTLEEMFCYTWLERYERDEVSEAIALQEIGKIAGPDGLKTVYPNLGNVLQERFSERKYSLDVVHRCASPLVNKDRAFAGILIISKVDILDQPSKPKFIDAQI